MVKMTWTEADRRRVIRSLEKDLREYRRQLDELPTIVMCYEMEIEALREGRLPRGAKLIP